MRYFTNQYCFTTRWMLNSTAIYDKNECTQVADLIKHQTVTCIFQHLPYSFTHASHLENEQLQSLHRLSKQHDSRVVSDQKQFLDSEQTSYSIHWTHCWVNGRCWVLSPRDNIWQNTVPRGMLSMVTLPYLMFSWQHSVVIVTKLTAFTQE